MTTKEKIDCPICEHQDFIKISTSGRDYFPTSFAICKKCGFAYQNPRYTKEELLKFYQNSYDKYYRPLFLKRQMTQEEYEGYKWGFNPLYNRVVRFLTKKDGMQILDVGSGEGTNLEYLGSKFMDSSLFAIEPSKDALNSLNEKGIKVLSNDVDSDWHLNVESKFDLIVLRHVFEHLQYPNAFLTKIKSVLKADGLLYIAVPDAYNLGSLTFGRDFSRLVHNYYFSKKSLTNIIIKNGLKVLTVKEGDMQHDAELFAVVGLSDEKGKLEIDSMELDKQLNYLKPFIDRDNKLKYKIIDYRDYLMRRIYPRKVKIKRALGLIKS
jgi:SAM-dependent methyltransferase